MSQETVILPPSASADGKRNAHYLNCKSQEQQRAYASCLHTIKMHREGKLNSMYSPCETAIRQGQCRAVAMQQEEELKGSAIYFKERAQVQLASSGAADAMRKFFDGLGKGIKAVFTPEPAPAPKKKSKSLLDSLEAPDYATAITDMVAEASAPKAPEPVRAPVAAGMPKLDIRPGESPLEAVRRMKQATLTN